MKSGRSTPPLSVVIVVSSLVMACGAVDQSDEGRALVSDSAGVVFVVNARSAPVDFVVHEIRRIGELEGAEPYLFGDIAGVAVTAGDSVLVANGSSTTVRLFSPEGRFLLEFLGSGDGPSELGGLERLGYAGGAVVATDYTRAAAFTPSGRFLGSGRTTGPNGEPILTLARRESGWTSLVYDPFEFERQELGVRVEWGRRIAITSDEGLMESDLIQLPPKTMFAAEALRGGLDWPLFDQGPYVEVDAFHGIYVTAIDRYRISVYDSLGHLERVVQREYDPVPITDADLESFVTAASAILAEEEPDRQEFYASRLRAQGEQRVVDTRPPLGRILVSHDGSFWVERIDEPRMLEVELRPSRGGLYSGIDATRWDLFDGDGRLLGSAEVPRGFTAYAVRGYQVTGVVQDELDVEYVVTLEADSEGR